VRRLSAVARRAKADNSRATAVMRRIVR
jgi:hypothetical protein